MAAGRPESPAPVPPAAAPAVSEVDDDDELPFPIEDYDDLRVMEILPLLPELDRQELREVRDYENAHRKRLAILSRIDSALGGAEPPSSPTSAPPGPPAAAVEPMAIEQLPVDEEPSAVEDLRADEPGAEAGPGAEAHEEPVAEGGPGAEAHEEPGPEAGREDEPGAERDEEEPVADQEAPATGGIQPVPQPAAVAGPARRDGADLGVEPEPAEAGVPLEPEGPGLPIADYDFLGVAEILPLLAELDDPELVEIRRYEAQGRGRATIVYRIDSLLQAPEEHEPEPEDEPSADENPLTDYDRLRVFQILSRLDQLNTRELRAVRAYEAEGRGRITILNQIDTYLAERSPGTGGRSPAAEVSGPEANAVSLAWLEAPDWPGSAGVDQPPAHSTAAHDPLVGTAHDFDPPPESTPSPAGGWQPEAHAAGGSRPVAHAVGVGEATDPAWPPSEAELVPELQPQPETRAPDASLSRAQASPPPPLKPALESGPEPEAARGAEPEPLPDTRSKLGPWREPRVEPVPDATPSWEPEPEPDDRDGARWPTEPVAEVLPEPIPDPEPLPDDRDGARWPTEPVAEVLLEPIPDPEPLPEVLAPPPGAARPDAGLPLADYDDLRPIQVLGLLDELDDDELVRIREYEEAHRGRGAILFRIDSLMTEAPGVASPAAVAPEPEPEGVAAATGARSDAHLPIAEYDDLRPVEILSLLDELEDDELVQVRAYEDAHRARGAILFRIDSLLSPPPASPVQPEPEPEPQPEPEPPMMMVRPDADLPIAEYDDLRPLEILGLLDELNDDELEQIREYEYGHLARSAILSRIDSLLSQPAEPEPEPSAEPEPEPQTEPEPEAVREAQPGPGAVAQLPIDDYESLRHFEVLRLLDHLDDRELQQIRAYEDSHRGRVTILRRIDVLLTAEPPAPAAAAETEPVAGETGVAHPSAVSPATAPTAVPAAAVPDAASLAIAEYDRLAVNEILPLLPELDDDELEAVRRFEEAHLGRTAIVSRIDALFEPFDEEADTDDEFEDAYEDDETPSTPAVGQPSDAPRVSPAGGGDGGGFEEDEYEDDEDEEVAVSEVSGDDIFPIADYDDLRVAEILPLLSQLLPDELEMVARHEEQLANRATILNRIDRLLSLSERDS